MAPLHSPGAWHRSPKRRTGGHGEDGWRAAVSCIPMLAGAVTVMVIHRGGVVFFILFASCTVLLVLLMRSTG